MIVFETIGRFIGEHLLLCGPVFLVWNLVVMLFYASDKRKAKRGAWRTPEATLIALAWALGGVGAMIGMYGFRHKTKHIKFIIAVPLAFVVQLALIVFSVIAAYYL